MITITKRVVRIRLCDAKVRYPDRLNEWKKLQEKGIKPTEYIRVELEE